MDYEHEHPVAFWFQNHNTRIHAYKYFFIYVEEKQSPALCDKFGVPKSVRDEVAQRISDGYTLHWRRSRSGHPDDEDEDDYVALEDRPLLPLTAGSIHRLLENGGTTDISIYYDEERSSLPPLQWPIQEDVQSSQRKRRTTNETAIEHAQRIRVAYTQPKLVCISEERPELQTVRSWSRTEQRWILEECDKLFMNSTLTDFSCGAEHALLLTAKGRIYSIGINQCGQLGTNAVDDVGRYAPEKSFAPYPVTLDARGTIVRRVICGPWWSSCIDDRGCLWVWGNYQWASSSGTQSEQLHLRSKFNAQDAGKRFRLDFSGIGKVQTVAFGESHALVLFEGGALYSIGDNRYGQLGTVVDAEAAYGMDRAWRLHRIEALKNEVIIDVKAGGNQSMCLTASKTLYKWGWNLQDVGSTSMIGVFNTQGCEVKEEALLAPTVLHDHVRLFACGKQLHAYVRSPPNGVCGNCPDELFVAGTGLETTKQHRSRDIGRSVNVSTTLRLDKEFRSTGARVLDIGCQYSSLIVLLSNGILQVVRHLTDPKESTISQFQCSQVQCSWTRFLAGSNAYVDLLVHFLREPEKCTDMSCDTYNPLESPISMKELCSYLFLCSPQRACELLSRANCLFMTSCKAASSRLFEMTSDPVLLLTPGRLGVHRLQDPTFLWRKHPEIHPNNEGIARCRFTIHKACKVEVKLLCCDPVNFDVTLVISSKCGDVRWNNQPTQTGTIHPFPVVACKSQDELSITVIAKFRFPYDFKSLLQLDWNSQGRSATMVFIRGTCYRPFIFRSYPPERVKRVRSLMSGSGSADAELQGGSMGALEIYNLDDREYVVKAWHVAHFDFRTAVEYSATFWHELEFLSKFRHRNIVSVQGAITEGPVRGLILEYMRKGSLSHVLDQRSQAGALLTDSEIRSACTDIARAMSFLHEKDIIHLDLKSQNILVSEDGTMKVTDFDVSSELAAVDRQDGIEEHESYRSDSVVDLPGTLPWMSPERVRSQITSKNRHLLFASDVYSFGIILYELSSCMKPYSDLEDLAIRNSILSGQRPQLPETASMWLRTLYERCTVEFPSDRPLFKEICYFLKHSRFPT